MLANKGGSRSPDFPDWFLNYARICFREFGDDVKYWATFNEPRVVCAKETSILEYNCSKTVVKTHALVYRMYEKEFKAKQKGMLKFALNN